ncbi:solute carrier family 12 member 8-like isoform X2 [Ornithodoros turicata]|uniref:solute carrier family 12 member 8-like isoform X2 n=1 Tax=Ornithodoros turicata TaxID=34597 RepID=UPI00313A3FF8
MRYYVRRRCVRHGRALSLIDRVTFVVHMRAVFSVPERQSFVVHRCTGIQLLCLYIGGSNIWHKEELTRRHRRHIVSMSEEDRGDTQVKAPQQGTEPNWGRFGLSGSEDTAQQRTICDSPQNELFHEDLAKGSKPWWSANFFVSEPVLFGTWDGVFTTCMIHLFSVIVFLRSGWIVGNAGIEHSVLIVVSTVVVCTVAVLSGIGVSQRCRIESGGVHVLVSHILGARIGGAVSLIYCFGQAVSCALHVTGFAESMGQLLKINDHWLERGMATGLVLLLLGINIAGVKWVVRLQFALLIILLLAALDFAVGTFIRYDYEHGVTGYHVATFANNSVPQYGAQENWFTIFGVFFPSMTGVFAGINMSDDLRNPVRDVPTGTMAAIGTCLFLYLVFVLGLGSTCQRWALKTDYLIAEKVSAVGVMLLSGLYISSMSSCLGALYTTPRILQSMANDGILPHILGLGKGPNRVPVVSLVLFALVIFVFVLAGKVNTLAPIVTIPFLLTYAAVEYAYFSMAMTYDQQRRRGERFRQQAPVFYGDSKQESGHYPGYGAVTSVGKASDLDQLFPERVHSPGGKEGSSVTESTSPGTPIGSKGSSMGDSDSTLNDKSCLLGRGAGPWPEISKKSNAWYSKLYNRWLAVLGIFAKLTIMFLVQWGYALAALTTLVLLWLCIGRMKPGSFPGVTEFKLLPRLKNLCLRCIGRKPSSYEQMVVAPMQPEVETTAAQITEENVDYASRERYHQSTSSQFQHLDSD